MNMTKKGGTVGNSTAKPRAMWPTIKRLLGYMNKKSYLIMLTIIVAIVGTVMQVLIPKMLGNATTLVFNGLSTQSGIDFSGLMITLGVAAGCYVSVFITSFLQQRMMTVVSQKTTYTLRNALKAKMNKVPISFFDQNSNGDLMSIAANDIDAVATNLQQGLTELISSAVLIVGVLGMMLYISPLLTVIACVMIPGSAAVMKLFTPNAQKNNKRYIKSMGELNSHIEETYQGFSVIKAFNAQNDALSQFKSSNDAMYESGWRAKFFGGCMMPAMMLVQNTVYVLIAAIGAVKVVGSTILIGNVQAFLQYSQQFSSPIARLSQIWGSFLSAIASAERVFDILDAKEMETYSGNNYLSSSKKAKVSFEHVRFSYSAQPLLTDFSLSVQAGEMVAIVGRTGAGKTTLIHLLERFYEIEKGSICIDGRDIRSMAHQEVRSRIGMVLQESWLFSGTIYDNIRYSNKNATKKQVIAAAKAAYADDFIQKLPDGYDTLLSEDAGNISQGQRQLLTIARALVADPEILILDEATSNVDSRTEAVIQQAMRKLLKGRTSFVVAHRLSTIYDADSIIVMDNGEIVETGTHQQLILNNGVYAQIYHSQFAQHCAS